MAQAPQLGPFTLQHPVARGGMGEVWRAVHVGSGRTVAIKLLLGERGLRGAEALQREARLLARLDHPNVATVFDLGRVPAGAGGGLVAGAPWVAIEWVGGGALHQCPRPRSWTGVLALARPLLLGLGHAHARGVVHRDVKPANILLLDADADAAVRHPVLTDFGLAFAGERAEDAAVRHPVLTDFGLAFAGERAEDAGGTPEFMPPEQWRGDATPQSDLYAFGCLLTWLVSGAPPFQGGPTAQRAAHLQAPVPPLRADVPVPRGLGELVEALLAKRMGDRPDSAAEVVEALDHLDVRDVLPGGESEPASLQSTFTFGGSVGVEGCDGDPWLDPSPPAAAPRMRPRLPRGWTTRRQRRNPAIEGSGLTLFGWRSLPTVGRVVERDVLWAGLVATSGDHRSRWFAVSAGPGSGKSHLLQWLAERAAETGAVDVVRGAGHVRPDRVTLVVLDDPTPDDLGAAAALAGCPVVVVSAGPTVPAGWDGAALPLGPLDPVDVMYLGREAFHLDRLTALHLADAAGGSPGRARAVVAGWLTGNVLRAGPEGFVAEDAALPDGVVEAYREQVRPLADSAADARVLDAWGAVGSGPVSRLAAVAQVSEAHVLAVQAKLAAACGVWPDESPLPGVVRRAIELEAVARGTWFAAHAGAAALARAQGRGVDLGRHAFVLGDWETAWRGLRSAGSQWRELGLLHAWEHCRSALAARRLVGRAPYDDDGLALLADAAPVAIELGLGGILQPTLLAAIGEVGLERAARLVHRVAEWQLRSGDVGGAELRWTELTAVQQGPHAAWAGGAALRSLCKLAYQRGDHTRAIALGTAAVARSTEPYEWSKAAFELACSYEQAGRFEPAREWYSAAAESACDGFTHSSALNGLAEIRRRQGDPAGARRDYLTVVQAQLPVHGFMVSASMVNLALCDLALGDLPAAEHAAARARDLALGGAQLLVLVASSFLLAVVTAAQSRWDEHDWHAEEGLGAASTLAYVDEDLCDLAERCAASCRAADRVQLAERWGRYAAAARRRLQGEAGG